MQKKAKPLPDADAYEHWRLFYGYADTEDRREQWRKREPHQRQQWAWEPMTDDEVATVQEEPGFAEWSAYHRFTARVEILVRLWRELPEDVRAKWVRVSEQGSKQ